LQRVDFLRTKSGRGGSKEICNSRLGEGREVGGENQKNLKNVFKRKRVGSSMEAKSGKEKKL